MIYWNATDAFFRFIESIYVAEELYKLDYYTFAIDV